MGDFSNDSPDGQPIAFLGGITGQTVADTLNNRPGCASAAANVIPDQGPLMLIYFPGNLQIPVECMDATAVDMMNQFVPRAEPSGGTFQTVPAFTMIAPTSSRLSLIIGSTISQNLSAYYYFNDSNLFDPYSRFQAGGATTLGFGAGTLERFSS